MVSSSVLVTGVARAQDPPPPGNDQPVVTQEVHVAGRRPPADTGTRIADTEVRQMPGVFGDPFRSVEVLPGVVPAASGVPFYFIRGSPPGNTGYFLDGIPVPALFHLAVGPSIVHPALVDKVDLYPGPVPAQYGRYAAGVISGSLREPEDHPHGQATLRLFDAGALVETPFDSGRGTALAAARYGYPALMVPIFAPDTRLAYWDYQARATYDVTDRDRVSVFTIGSYDSLSQRQSDGHFAEQLGFSFHRVDLRLDHRLGEDGHMRAAVTVGTDRSGQEGLDFTKQLVGGRLIVDQPLSDTTRIRGGWDALYEPYQTSTTNGLVAQQYPDRTNFFSGAWVDVSVHPFSWLELVPGLRGDVYTSKTNAGIATQAAIDPRLVARSSVTKKVTLVTAAGVAHQPPSSLIVLPGLDIGPLSAGLQESVQLSQGIEAKLPEKLFVSATAFYDSFRGLSDASFSCTTSADEVKIAACSGSYLTGRAYGVELLVKRAITERIGGLISYTLSRSVRDNPYWFGSGGEVPSRFDRPHVVNVIVTGDLGKSWYASGRLFAYSGSPYSRLFSPPGGSDPHAIPPYNAQRLDPFSRLDVRIEKRWVLSNGVRLSLFAEMLNALLQKESVGVTCDWANQPTILPNGQLANVCTQSQVGPIAIPSLGIEGAY